MFKAWLVAILNFFGLEVTKKKKTQSSASSTTSMPLKSSSSPPTVDGGNPIAVKIQPSPPKIEAPKLYHGTQFVFPHTDRDQARKILFREIDGKISGPTAEQEKVIFSQSCATKVIAGAGSGKSTTLVKRILFMKKYLKIDFSQMAVFTFTSKSRIDLIKRLLNEAPAWGVNISQQRAERTIRTFHSKALQLARATLGTDEQIFEFLGIPLQRKQVAPDAVANQVETNREDALSSEEAEANSIEGPIKLDHSPEQAEVLKRIYSECYGGDEEFRKAISILYHYTVRTPPWERDQDFYRKIQSIRQIHGRDGALCQHLEHEWAKSGVWPISGVQERDIAGQRFQLEAYGTSLFANGYIERLDTYVILGNYPGISKEHISVEGKVLIPTTHVYEKRKVLLCACDKAIRYISNIDDARLLARQLALTPLEIGLSAPAVELRLPGEFGCKPAFSNLYAFGSFVECIGQQPCNVYTQLSERELTDAEKATLYAVEAYFKRLNRHLSNNGLVRFNQLFSRLGRNGESLEKVDAATLISAAHLMIDEFQDISPLIVNFVVGIHEELVRKTSGREKPSLMCVGDDWQSIYGWRGSSPHFLLDLHNHFPGAPREAIWLEDNFRSTQNIINCGESFIQHVSKRSTKRGIAKNKKLKDLPYKTTAIEEYKDTDVKKVLELLLKSMSGDEEAYILASTNEEADKYKRINDRRLMATTFHQSKGLEADYVILIGAPKHFGSNNLKNKLYELAKFPQSFDEAQRDEAYRVAYVAATRAKKLCLWFSAPKNTVLDQVPADNQSRQVMDVPEVMEFLRAYFTDQLISA